MAFHILTKPRVVFFSLKNSETAKSIFEIPKPSGEIWRKNTSRLLTQPIFLEFLAELNR